MPVVTAPIPLPLLLRFPSPPASSSVFPSITIGGPSPTVALVGDFLSLPRVGVVVLEVVAVLPREEKGLLLVIVDGIVESAEPLLLLLLLFRLLCKFATLYFGLTS